MSCTRHDASSKAGETSNNNSLVKENDTMATKHGSPGAGYDPNKHHYHDGLHDDEIRDMIASPVHGLRGVQDEDGTADTRNQYWLKDQDRPDLHNLDKPNADKRRRPEVRKDDGDRGEQKSSRP